MENIQDGCSSAEKQVRAGGHFLIRLTELLCAKPTHNLMLILNSGLNVIFLWLVYT